MVNLRTHLKPLKFALTLHVVIRWGIRRLKRVYCALFHFPYHRKYTIKERSVKICDVCDRNEDDVKIGHALVFGLLVVCAVATWAGLIYLAIRFW
jgi:hypothetical protein